MLHANFFIRPIYLFKIIIINSVPAYFKSFCYKRMNHWSNVILGFIYLIIKYIASCKKWHVAFSSLHFHRVLRGFMLHRCYINATCLYVAWLVFVVFYDVLCYMVASCSTQQKQLCSTKPRKIR